MLPLVLVQQGRATGMPKTGFLNRVGIYTSIMKRILILIFAAVLITESKATVIPGNPENSQQKVYLALEQFFKSYDTAILRRLKKPVAVIDEEEAARPGEAEIIYMQGKNAQLIPLLVAINPVAYNPAEMSVADEMLVYAGVLELYNQMQVPGNKQVTGRAGLPWACIRDVILSAFNIGTIIVEFQAMISGGASWSVVRPFLWQNLRRYGGWFAVAGVIWDIATECFKL